MKFFVSKQDRIDVSVFVYENNGNVEAVVDKSEVPAEYTPTELKFFFRKPSYEDSRVIFSASQMTSVSSDVKIDLIALQNSVLKRLLIDWNLKDDNENPIECNQKNIESLMPTIARAAAAGILAKGQI